MNISLTPELEKVIQDHVASGQYNNASELMREALRLWIQKDIMGQYYDEWLQAQIEIGWQQADHGETESHNMDDIIQDVLAGPIS